MEHSKCVKRPQSPLRGGYTGEWSQKNYSDIFTWYSQVFYVSNWKVGVNHLAVSSHLWVQIGFESGRRAWLPCLHQLPSLGHNHIFREAVSATTAVCNNNSTTDCSAHISIQPRSLTAKAASFKDAESRLTCRLPCWQLSSRWGSQSQKISHALQSHYQALFRRWRNWDRWRASDFLEVIWVISLAVPGLETNPGLGQVLANCAATSLGFLLLPQGLQRSGTAGTLGAPSCWLWSNSTAGGLSPFSWGCLWWASSWLFT